MRPSLSRSFPFPSRSLSSPAPPHVPDSPALPELADVDGAVGVVERAGPVPAAIHEAAGVLADLLRPPSGAMAHLSDEGESGCEGGEGGARDRGRMTGRRVCGVVGAGGRERWREREKMRETRTEKGPEAEAETERERERERERDKERKR